MIYIEEIPAGAIDEFWIAHLRYLVDDGIAIEEEDRNYFQSEEYRSVIYSHMLREQDRHHLVYFVRDGVRIGAASYCTYQSEDGKCFILDFWVFPSFRGNGTGHRCFDVLKEYTAEDGALYYEINCDGREDRMRFWHSNGFADNGLDEWGVPLLIRRQE